MIYVLQCDICIIQYIRMEAPSQKRVHIYTFKEHGKFKITEQLRDIDTYFLETFELMKSY